MGKLSDWLIANGMSEKDAEGTKLAEKIIGIAVPAYSYAKNAISAAESIDRLFDIGIFSKDKPDPIAELQSQLSSIKKDLNEGFDQVLGAIRVSDESERFRDIDGLITPMRNALIDLRRFKPDDPTFNEEKYHGDCTNAIESLKWDAPGAEGYWYRYFYEGYEGYKDEWSGELKPKLNGKSVFDYRFLLPLYLETVTSLLVVAAALYPNSFKEKYFEYFKNSADSLFIIHEKIRDSIVAIRKPEIVDLVGYWQTNASYSDDWEAPVFKGVTFEYDPNHHYDSTTPNWNTPNWNAYNCIYGVVEKFSEDNILKNFQIAVKIPPYPGQYLMIPGREIPHDPENTPTYADWSLNDAYFSDVEKYNEELAEFYKKDFSPKYAIKTLILWKQLYNKIGLPSVWHAINLLRGLIGESMLNEFDYGCWSLREANTIVYKELVNSSVDELPREISLNQLAMTLGEKDPISLRKIFEV